MRSFTILKLFSPDVLEYIIFFEALKSGYPTKIFRELQNPSFVELYAAQKRRSTDLKALKLGKGRSGRACRICMQWMKHNKTELFKYKKNTFLFGFCCSRFSMLSRLKNTFKSLTTLKWKHKKFKKYFGSWKKLSQLAIVSQINRIFPLKFFQQIWCCKVRYFQFPS